MAGMSKEDQIECILDKICGLAHLEEGEEGKNEERIQEFRQLLPQLKDEKFVTYRDNVLWRNKESYLPSKGTLFITQESIILKSDAHPHIIPFSCVSSISKETTLGLLSASIKLVTTGENKSEIIVTTLDRNSTWEVLNSLWQDRMDKLRKILDPDVATEENTSISMAKMKKEALISQFHLDFKIREFPHPNNTFSCILWKIPVPGTLYATENFLCFQSTVGHYKVVIAWVNVCTLEPTVESLLFNAIKIKTSSGNEIIFCVGQNRDTLYASMQRTWLSQCSYKERKLTELKESGVPFIDGERHVEEWERDEIEGEGEGGAEDSSFSSNGWKLDSWMVEDPNYKALQGELEERWESYFEKYGFLVDPIQTFEFKNQLEYGIPDIYRSSLWQLCSGSLYKKDANPGYYGVLFFSKIPEKKKKKKKKSTLR
eukprot:TRINITY_DN691_c0_g4_i1.p1 TRINITY_DN691_c0_g4~~TRINITY_DN691_c0_g4_i1.p1  ORF type:complete len:429 (+),score=110.96 TRINITY_DN691_c0_g4_i1:359-1645(+)